MNKKLIEISKFLSFVLRHQPSAIGITLDSEGWTSIATLVAAASKHGQQINHDVIHTIVMTGDKKRFALSEDGLHIRAMQGHSTDSVDIKYAESVPPEVLYHGTATRFLDPIRQEGLLPGARQYVHLSQDEKIALAVGQRHGKPVALKVKALLMYEQGFKFFKAENGVWLTERVSVMYLTPDANL